MRWGRSQPHLRVPAVDAGMEVYLSPTSLPLGSCPLAGRRRGTWVAFVDLINSNSKVVSWAQCRANPARKFRFITSLCLLALLMRTVCSTKGLGSWGFPLIPLTVKGEFLLCVGDADAVSEDL